MLLGDKLQNIIVKQGEGAAPIKKTAHAPFLVNRLSRFTHRECVGYPLIGLKHQYPEL
ncbi:Uncharacterised protein [Edwardsiella tarda]|nr:Uncharacterised protein [Edwardsiella tarda]STD45414.1 Uncharacterised protein [Edwardsiella tarda]